MYPPKGGWGLLGFFWECLHHVVQTTSLQGLQGVSNRHRARVRRIPLWTIG